MEMQTATLREFRDDFPLIQRRVDQHGEIVITHRGKPLYVLSRLARPTTKRKLPPRVDYWARLQKQQSTPMQENEARRLRDDNGGDH
jgi:antitoxin (DNA-binding transcriptional repressor) of toxin-antitoxin stability system